MIGFGSLVGPLSHSVLYLQWVLPQHSPSSDFGENQLSRGLISLSLLLSSHLRIFQHSRVRSSTQCYLGFNLLKSRSPPLRVYCQRLVAHLALAFASPPVQRTLGWPLTITRRLIMQKASSHRAHLNVVPHSFWCASFIRFKGFLPLWSHSANGQMGPAPTHCMQSVSGLFHSPQRGSFHLSLAVLVHYRLPRSI